MKNLITKILILLYLLFSFSNATHIHVEEDGHAEDCEVCILTKAFTDTDVPSFDIINDCTDCTYHHNIIISSDINILFLKGFFANAPPFTPFS